MKVHFSALIDKSIPSENSKLAKKLMKDLKKSLKLTKSSVNYKEHNTLIFLTAKKPIEKPLESKTIKEIQNKINLHLEEYYIKNKSKLQK